MHTQGHLKRAFGEAEQHVSIGWNRAYFINVESDSSAVPDQYLLYFLTLN